MNSPLIGNVDTRTHWKKRHLLPLRMSLPDPIAALALRQEAMAAQLIAWAEINSGSDHLAGLERMRAALLSAFAEHLPGSAEAVPLPGTAACAIRLRVRPDAPVQVLLSGHYDTVYSADHAFQRCERLSSRILRGPGVADMKGGLLQMLEALRAFEATPHSNQLGWEILLTPDEETGSAASLALLTETAPRHQLALIFEPARANGNLVRMRMGTGIFRVTCTGRAAHAGRDPQKGRNAIIALAEFLPLADALNREMNGVLLNVGSIRGGGTVNVVPDHAEAEINLRVARGEDAERVVARLRELAAPINRREGYRLEITGRFNRPPKEVTPAEETWFTRWQECGHAVGLKLGWEDVGGGSDGNLLGAAGLACIDGIGPIGDGVHSPAETVDLASLAQRAQVTALFLFRLAQR